MPYTRPVSFFVTLSPDLWHSGLRPPLRSGKSALGSGEPGFRSGKSAFRNGELALENSKSALRIGHPLHNDESPFMTTTSSAVITTASPQT